MVETLSLYLFFIGGFMIFIKFNGEQFILRSFQLTVIRKDLKYRSGIEMLQTDSKGVILEHQAMTRRYVGWSAKRILDNLYEQAEEIALPSFYW